MPKPRKPTSQLSELTLKRNTGRYADRANEPKPTNILGPPPKHLAPTQKKLWKELVKRIPDGVLYDCDTYIVELTVRLIEKMRTGTLMTSEVSQYRGCLASLGLTPADRSRVSVSEPQTDDEPFSEPSAADDGEI